MVKPQTIALSGYADTLDIPYNPDEDPWCGSMTIRYPQKKGVWTKEITNCTLLPSRHSEESCSWGHPVQWHVDNMTDWLSLSLPPYMYVYIHIYYIQYIESWEAKSLHGQKHLKRCIKTYRWIGGFSESSKIAFKLGSDNELTKITEAIVLSSC